MSIFSFNILGILLIVIKLAVTSSPTVPFPLVAPLTNFPSLYSSATDNPSIFVSTTYFNSFLFSLAIFCILAPNVSNSSKENIS